MASCQLKKFRAVCSKREKKVEITPFSTALPRNRSEKHPTYLATLCHTMSPQACAGAAARQHRLHPTLL